MYISDSSVTVSAVCFWVCVALSSLLSNDLRLLVTSQNQHKARNAAKQPSLCDVDTLLGIDLLSQGS